jgi:hypothetical protein
MTVSQAIGDFKERLGTSIMDLSGVVTDEAVF